ncbi:MAG: YHYH protein [Leptospiraceae bacterium]|nr:YHYH protein [Leptospiraceae bacterium]
MIKFIFQILFILSLVACETINGNNDNSDKTKNLLLAAAALSSRTSTTTTTTSSTYASQVTCLGSTIKTTSIDSTMPTWIANNFACVKAYTSTESGVAYYVFETEAVPPHKSPYWGTSSSNWEAMPSGNTQQISNFNSQSYKFKIRQTPTTASGGSASAPGVAAGVAINGVVFFFGQASPGNSLSAELSTFDSAQGHPDGGFKRYHYHALPKYITSYETRLLGIMSDGYPIYGNKEEDGTTPSTTSTTGSTNQYPALSANTYGHTHSTKDFPNGTFHYHVTNWDSSVNIPSLPVYTYGTLTISNITF